MYLLAHSPLCGWGCDADHHDGGIGQDLLKGLIVFALFKIVAQLLKTHKHINLSNTQVFMFKLH